MIVYFLSYSNECLCTTWQNVETRMSHLFAQMLYYCYCKLLLDFFNIVDMKLICCCYDFVNLLIS